MQYFMLKSKIHRAMITGSDLNYQGSISICKDLLKSAEILPNQQVDVVNINNGERFTTYAIESEIEGEIQVNGAAARKVQKGDKIIIISYALIDDKEASTHQPKILLMDDRNKIIGG